MRALLSRLGSRDMRLTSHSAPTIATILSVAGACAPVAFAQTTRPVPDIATTKPSTATVLPLDASLTEPHNPYGYAGRPLDGGHGQGDFLGVPDRWRIGLPPG